MPSQNLVAETALVLARRRKAEAVFTAPIAPAYMLVRVLEISSAYIKVAGLMTGTMRYLRCAPTPQQAIEDGGTGIYHLVVENDTITAIASR